MALKIVSRPKYATTVDVRTLHLQGSLQVTFIALAQSEIRALEQRAVDEGLNVQKVVLAEVVKDHEAVEINGQQVPFGPASLDKLLDYPGIGPAILRRYYASLWEETQGNSEPPPSGS